jgi:putative chitinase
MPHLSPPVPEMPGTRDEVDTDTMDTLVLLKPGDTGNAVRVIQQRLQMLGFNAGTPDGQFGPQTQQALGRFQASRGLSPDGLVDHTTLHALGYEVDSSAPQPARVFSVEHVQTIFPGTSTQNIQTYLPLVLKALAEFGLSDTPMTLAALATIRAETGLFAPISESPSQYNTASGGAPYALYDFRADLGNGAIGDGARYKGRGFVQLTGKSNYHTYSQKLGMGETLHDHPELANDPLIAARLLACFLKDKEGILRSALAQGDYVTARKAVNGGTHGLDAFTLAYRTGAQIVEAV